MRYVLAGLLILIGCGALLIALAVFAGAGAYGIAVAIPYLELGTLAVGALTICGFVEAASNRQAKELRELLASSLRVERELAAKREAK